MDDWKIALFLGIGSIGVILILIFGAEIGGQLWNLWLQPKIIVQIDGREVFRGSNACIDESSLGAATRVQINRGPLCMLPGPKYTSNNVHTVPILN
jgi:hypothetical protein